MSLDIAAVFGAGLLTFVTPCVLPLVPIYLAVLMGGASADARMGLRARLTLLGHAGLFVLGFTTIFVLLGLTATSLGGALTEHRTQLALLGGLLIFLFGLKFLDVLRVGWLERDARLDDRRLQTRYPWLNALVMGLVFALGWTPCVGPILGSVLTYTASATADPWTGAGYLLAYGLGFAVPLLGLALFADGARSLVRRISPRLPILQKVTGALLVVIGLHVMLGAGQAPAASVAPGTAAAASIDLQPPLGQPTRKPRMVEFVTSSCSVCRQMIPVVGLIERDCGGSDVDVVKVDVSNAENRKLAQAYQVRGVPTFVFLDQNGKEIARLVGYQELPSLRQALATLVGDSCQGVGNLDALFETPSRCSAGAPARAGSHCGS